MSASERPALRVITGDGELDTDSVAIPSDVALLQDRLAELGRKNAALKGELTKLRKADPLASDITAVLEHWHAVCRRSHRAVKIPVDGARAKAVKARLNDEYTVDQLKRVCTIARELPFEQYGNRYCEAAPGRTRRDDLVYLMASEARVESILRIRSFPAAHKAYEHYVHGLATKHPAVMAVLAMLGEQAPHGEVLARAAVWAHAREART